jgi:nitroreductase
LDTAELAKLIKTRRSIRNFQDKPVPEELLLQAVELATWAPNGGNGQNWKWFIILDKKVMNAVADAIDKGLDTMMSWPEMANAGPPPRSSILRKSPALIVVTTARSLQSADDLYAKITANPNEKKGFGAMQDVVIAKRAKTDPKAKEMYDGLQIINGRIQSTSAAVATLMLVLHQMGLGSLWMTGPLHAKADIERALKLPAGLDVVTLIPVGYPAESPVRDRKPVSEVCQVIK